ncbi:MAG: hypothetical protein AAF557_22500 [Pseudomonadota bacterium]
MPSQSAATTQPQYAWTPAFVTNGAAHLKKALPPKKLTTTDELKIWKDVENSLKKKSKLAQYVIKITAKQNVEADKYNSALKTFQNVLGKNKSSLRFSHRELVQVRKEFAKQAYVLACAIKADIAGGKKSLESLQSDIEKDLKALDVLIKRFENNIQVLDQLM